MSKCDEQLKYLFHPGGSGNISMLVSNRFGSNNNTKENKGVCNKSKWAIQFFFVFVFRLIKLLLTASTERCKPSRVKCSIMQIVDDPTTNYQGWSCSREKWVSRCRYDFAVHSMKCIELYFWSISLLVLLTWNPIYTDEEAKVWRVISEGYKQRTLPVGIINSL